MLGQLNLHDVVSATTSLSGAPFTLRLGWPSGSHGIVDDHHLIIFIAGWSLALG